MRTGVQFTATMAPNATVKWYSANWPVAWHVVWYLMPTTPRPGAPELEWDVAVERADAGHVTYWITVVNKTAIPVAFEGRYAVLN